MSVAAQQGRGLQAAGGDGLLMGEVSHATGNLLHRMRYWTSMLEAETLRGPAAEAVTELRSSLDGLQQLIARTMELLRPSDVRAIAIPVDDVVGTLAIRFGVDAGQALATAPGASAWPFPVLVDPALLDRGLILLAEAFERDPEGAEAGFSIDRGDPGPETPPLLMVRMRARRRASLRSDPYAPVHHDVNLALATKLLGETGCICTAFESDGIVRLVISLPLEAAR